MRWRSLRAIVPMAIFLCALQGNWNDTSTGIDLDKLPHFPLTKVRSGLLKPGQRVTFDVISAVATLGEVRLNGVGKSGRRWEVHIFGIDEVWRVDLDGNGTQDYVLFASGPYGNGRTAPSFSLSILLMNPDGMPVPFFTVVYKGENGDGIKHLVDFNHNGHAELLISTYDENTSDTRVEASCSGHWVNQLYRFSNLGAEEIQGSMGGMTFPVVHDWTYRGAECPEVEKPYLAVQPAALYNHETGGKGLITTIRGSSDQSGAVAIEPAGGCREIIPTLVVYDTSRVRRIAFPNQSDDYAEMLVSKVRADRARVELRGVNKQEPDGYCSANLLWAR